MTSRSLSLDVLFSDDLRAQQRFRTMDLRDITPTRGRLPTILQAVRAHHRSVPFGPHQTVTVVTWVARYLQFYPTKPLGMLNTDHATAFLSHVGNQRIVTRADQAQARDAITFFHVVVLGHTDFTPPTTYVKPPETRPPRRHRERSPTTFWRLANDGGSSSLQDA